MSNKKADKDTDLDRAVGELGPIIDRLSRSRDRRVQGLGAIMAAGCACALAGEPFIVAANQMVLPIMQKMEEGLKRMERDIFKPKKKRGK